MREGCCESTILTVTPENLPLPRWWQLHEPRLMYSVTIIFLQVQISRPQNVIQCIFFYI